MKDWPCNNGKITTFLGGGEYRFWCPRAQVSFNLKNRDLDYRHIRSMLKISYAASPCLSQLILAQFALKMLSRSPNSQKTTKLLFWRSGSSTNIEFGGNRKPVYDFLLVINSNLGPISHRYWDTATYWLEIANFLTFSHLALSFGVTAFEFMKKLYGSWN